MTKYSEQAPKYISLKDFIQKTQSLSADEIKKIENIGDWLAGAFAAGCELLSDSTQTVYETHGRFADTDWFLIAKRRNKQ